MIVHTAEHLLELIELNCSVFILVAKLKNESTFMSGDGGTNFIQQSEKIVVCENLKLLIFLEDLQ